MRLDLREIIEVPGVRLPFSHTLDTQALDLPGVTGYPSPPQAQGVVRNAAGALELDGTLRAELTVLCDRCGRPFPLKIDLPLYVPLAQEGESAENPDTFFLDGDALNLSELLETCLILNMDSKRLCKPDCLGLCPTCGADLNEGPCACGRQTDPRLAGLKQLLDMNNTTRGL